MTDTPHEQLTLADGRTLAWQRYGDPQGRPLYVFHGFPGCRLQAAMLHGPAQAAGVCLVAADRPGFGASSPAPKRTILGWADDVAQLADTLGHERFGVVGMSCGGPYALACAHRLPQRVRYAGLLAGIGPMDIPHLRREQMPALKALFGLARVSPVLASPFLSLDWLMFRHDAEKAVRTLAKMLTVPDQAMLAADPALARSFGESLAEAYRQGIGGAMTEAALIARPRGYRLEDRSTSTKARSTGMCRWRWPGIWRAICHKANCGSTRRKATSPSSSRPRPTAWPTTWRTTATDYSRGLAPLRSAFEQFAERMSR